MRSRAVPLQGQEKSPLDLANLKIGHYKRAESSRKDEALFAERLGENVV